MRPKLTGLRFAKLLVHEFKYGTGGWRCVCDCGNERFFATHDLILGNNSSCGCMSTLKTPRQRHGMSKFPEYQIWKALIKRCENPGQWDYQYYGGRGISVCDRWRYSFPSFLADVGRRPDGMWIERLDNSKGYEPGNVEWRTPTQQQRNKRNNHRYPIMEENLTIREAHEIHGSQNVCFNTAKGRVGKGWPIKVALAQPPRRNA